MASTFLVRLKVGPKLVDAKGVNKLYRASVGPTHLLLIVLAPSRSSPRSCSSRRSPARTLS